MKANVKVSNDRYKFPVLSKNQLAKRPRQFGQYSRECAFNDTILTMINYVCDKHKCATSMCHCTLDSKHVHHIVFPMGTRVPRKTAKNRWKQLLK